MKFFVTILTLVAAVSAAPKASKLGYRNSYKIATQVLDGQPHETPRIIGGNEATPHSLPYAALLEIYSDENGWYCTGALISENYVITSGHCCYNAVDATVILGAHRPFDIEESQLIVRSEEIIVHENYDNEEIINDIAVIRLDTPAYFDEYIQIIALPTLSDASNDYVDALTTVGGWGLTYGHGTTMSEVLNFVQLTVISNLDCQTYFGTLESSILCTSGLEDKGLCGGDAGAPLVTNQVLIGVGSFGVPYCQGGYPSAFTRVTSFLDWLGENTDVVIID